MRFYKDESGATAVILALSMTVILIAAALVLDLGLSYIDASSAQNVADAIALSIGHDLPIDQYDLAAMTTVKSEAAEYAIKNGVYDFDTDDVVLSDLENGRYHSISVSVTKTNYTNFSGIVGIDTITVKKLAQVSVKPVGAISGAVPLGISEELYDNAVATGQTEHIVLKVGGGDGIDGFYGFIVLDDSSGNAAVLEKWFKYGYDGENYVGEALPIATGNKTSVANDGVDYRLSLCNHYVGYGGCTVEHYDEDCPRVVYVLIYEFIDYTTVQIVGFAPFILEASNSIDEIQGSFIKSSITYSDQISEKDCGVYTCRLTG